MGVKSSGDKTHPFGTPVLVVRCDVNWFEDLAPVFQRVQNPEAHQGVN